MCVYSASRGVGRTLCLGSPLTSRLAKPVKQFLGIANGPLALYSPNKLALLPPTPPFFPEARPEPAKKAQLRRRKKLLTPPMVRRQDVPSVFMSAFKTLDTLLHPTLRKHPRPKTTCRPLGSRRTVPRKSCRALLLPKQGLSLSPPTRVVLVLLTDSRPLVCRPPRKPRYLPKVTWQSYAESPVLFWKQLRPA